MPPGHRPGLLLIVSGGQSGVDRAALLVARQRGIPVAGWCPLGGWAEDLPHPPGVRALFPELVETPTADPAERTRRNVRLCDRLLVLCPPACRSLGTRLAIAEAGALGRDVVVLDPLAADAPQRLAAALRPGGLLNLAGPRESEWPGAEAATRALLEEALTAAANRAHRPR